MGECGAWFLVANGSDFNDVIKTAGIEHLEDSVDLCLHVRTNLSVGFGLSMSLTTLDYKVTSLMGLLWLITLLYFFLHLQSEIVVDVDNIFDPGS